MSAFVEPTRQEIRAEYLELGIEGERLDTLVDKKLKDRVHQAMQGVVYNLNTMHSRAGQMWAV
jgi:ribonucleoside-triphosphate reductase